MPCAAVYCHGGEPHHRLEDWDVFSWPIASFSARQDMLRLTGCPMFHTVHRNTTNESQKMMVSTWPADHFTLNLCFLVQLGCTHTRVHRLLLKMNGRSMYHNHQQLNANSYFLYCITLQETETGHHSCCFVIYKHMTHLSNSTDHTAL